MTSKSTEQNRKKLSKITKALFSRNIHMQQCPMCDESEFSVNTDPIYNLSKSETPIGNEYKKCVPSALITCENCGLMLQYSLEVLEVDLEEEESQ